jgi:hypothetical protein
MSHFILTLCINNTELVKLGNCMYIEWNNLLKDNGMDAQQAEHLLSVWFVLNSYKILHKLKSI